MLTNEQIDFTVQIEVNVQAKYHLEWLSETCRLSSLEVKDSKGLLSNRRDSLNQESPDTGNVKKHLAGPTSSCKLPPRHPLRRESQFPLLPFSPLSFTISFPLIQFKFLGETLAQFELKCLPLV